MLYLLQKTMMDIYMHVPWIDHSHDMHAVSTYPEMLPSHMYYHSYTMH